MWVHTGDEFKIDEKVFIVKEVFGLYSTSMVGVILTSGDERKVFEIKEFNNLVDKGEILKHNVKIKPNRSY